MQEAAAVRVDEGAAEMELPVGERQAVDLEAEDALTRGRSPAQAFGRGDDTSENGAVVVAQLERDPRGLDPGIAGDDELDGHRLARGERGPRLAVGVEQPRRDDPRLAASPFAQSRRELVRAPLVCEQASVLRDRVTGVAVEDPGSVAEQHSAIAEPLDGLGVMRDEHDRAATPLELVDLPEALALEFLITDREDLVQEEHVRLNVRGDRKAEPHVHTGGVGAHRQVDEPLQLGECDDLVHQLTDACPGEPMDRAVQVDVLAPREVLVEPGTELEERADSPPDFDPARGRLEDSRDQLQQRRLAGAVAADEPECLAGLDLERDIAKGPDLVHGRASAPRDDRVLERPIGAFRDPEALRHPVDDDLSRARHRESGPASARFTIWASTSTKPGSAFGMWIRSSSIPSSPARSCASMSRSQRISR